MRRRRTTLDLLRLISSSRPLDMSTQGRTALRTILGTSLSQSRTLSRSLPGFEARQSRSVRCIASTSRACSHPQPPSPSPNQPHLTPDEAASKKLEERDTKPPPYLARALGIKEPPRKGKQSREEWRADLLNREKRVEERRHL